MLNRARIRLTRASHWAGAATAGVPWASSATAPNSAARARLTSGPAMAMRNSAPALLGSRVISATPPKKKRVMARTGTLLRRAKKACPSSWASTEPKKSTLVSAPSSQ